MLGRYTTELLLRGNSTELMAYYYDNVIARQSMNFEDWWYLYLGDIWAD